MAALEREHGSMAATAVVERPPGFVILSFNIIMDRNGPFKSRWLGYFVDREVGGVPEPSGSDVDGSRRLGGREDGGGERGLGRR